MSPSTHQDSPKVPEAGKLTICLKCGEATAPGSLGCFRDPNIGHGGPFRTETYILVSALLSDEVVEAGAAQLIDYGLADTAKHDQEVSEQAARKVLQAAIGHVGGAK